MLNSDTKVSYSIDGLGVEVRVEELKNVIGNTCLKQVSGVASVDSSRTDPSLSHNPASISAITPVSVLEAFSGPLTSMSMHTATESTGSYSKDSAETLAQSSRPTQIGPSLPKPPSYITIPAYTVQRCKQTCPCSCHTTGYIATPHWLRQFCGALFVGYIGNPFLRAKCDRPSCNRPTARSMRLNYSFPSWFVHKAVVAFVQESPLGEPVFGLILRKTIYKGEKGFGMFDRAKNDDVLGLKNYFESGAALPNDIHGMSGQTALQVSVQENFKRLKRNG